MKEWDWIRDITGLESKNQVVICGRRDKSDPASLYMFQNNPDGELVETRMDRPCPHYTDFNRLTTVVLNGKELLAVSCTDCSDIKLVDMETKQVTPVFKSPSDPPWGMCSGPGGGLFVALDSIHTQQLENSFNIINTFKYLSTPMCYLPTPHNTLVGINGSELRAVSMQDRNTVWNQPCETIQPHCLLYCPQ